MAEYQIPYFRAPVSTIPAGGRINFPIAVNYFLFESVVDLVGATNDPLLTVQIENNLQYKIPALYKVNFNNTTAAPDDVVAKRVTIINENAFACSFVAAGGMGDVTSERSQVVGNVSIVPDWAAAYSDTIAESAGAGIFTSWNVSNTVTSGVTVYDVVQGGNGTRRILTCHLRETSGLPNAEINLSMNSSGNVNNLLVCYAGQTAQLSRSFLTNMSASKIVISYQNGATGMAHGTYENAPVTPSGAA